LAPIDQVAGIRTLTVVLVVAFPLKRREGFGERYVSADKAVEQVAYGRRF